MDFFSGKFFKRMLNTTNGQFTDEEVDAAQAHEVLHAIDNDYPDGQFGWNSEVPVGTTRREWWKNILPS